MGRMSSAGSESGASGGKDLSPLAVTEREPGRAAAFSDAVVAVAMTALVLPLLDINISGTSTFGSLWDEYGSQFLAMLLSFLLIALFWLIHHKIWFAVRTVNTGFLWLNIGWLLGIVLIPFGTVLMYETNGFPTLGYQIYPGLIFYTSLMLGLIVYMITTRSSIKYANVTPQPLWYALRFAAWWLVVFIACLINAEALGQYFLEWSALPMVLLGIWRPKRVQQQTAKIESGGPAVELG